MSEGAWSRTWVNGGRGWPRSWAGQDEAPGSLGGWGPRTEHRPVHRGGMDRSCLDWVVFGPLGTELAKIQKGGIWYVAAVLVVAGDALCAAPETTNSSRFIGEILNLGTSNAFSQ